ncbi:MAG: hypothetical protein ACWGNO_00065 [Desulfobacterales bacterium]
MSDPYPIRRDQLAKFIPDNETILRFERLFQIVSGVIAPGSGGGSGLDQLKEELEFYIMTRGID